MQIKGGGGERKYCAINKLYTREMSLMEFLSLVRVGKNSCIKNGIGTQINICFLYLSDKMLNKIQGILNRFIWINQRPWVSSKNIEKRLEKGGLAVPHIGK